MRFAVIMAGGSGTRLWPLSRRGTPKQLLRLIEGKSLLRIASAGWVSGASRGFRKRGIGPECRWRENEEQHHRLEDAGGRVGHMHHGLRHLSADISDREDQRRQKTPTGWRRPRKETMMAVKP